MLSRLARLAALVGHARARNLLIACGLFIGVALAGASAWFMTELHHLEVADAKRELHNTAIILAEQTDRGFQAAELVQVGLIEHMRSAGVSSVEQLWARMGTFQAHENLKDRIAGLSVINSLGVIDASGTIVNLSRMWPVTHLDVADRDFFKAINSQPSLTTFIGEPVLTRSDGIWTILFSRRFTGTDGQFLGIVNAAMHLSDFERVFSRIALLGGGSFGLFRDDGVLLARAPPIAAMMGQQYGDTGEFRRLTHSLEQGIIRLRSKLDGQDRLVAAQALSHYPLIITVSNTMDAVLARWRSDVMVYGAASALLELVIAATILLGVRHLRGYERLQAAEAAQAQAEAELTVAEERERSARELQAQWAQFELAIGNMHQGLCMYDRSNRILILNRSFIDIFGLPDDVVVPGMDYQQVTSHIERAGRVTPRDMIELRERRKELLERRESTTFNWELASGRTITVTHQPMHDGWLTTYDDVTERCQAEARIAHMAHHDALTNLPNRVLFHNRLVTALAYARRGRMLALLCLDLDQFKAVNDTLGHPIGDALLKAVALRLAERCRETDTVARLGGDEFAIVQTEISKPTEATAFASRLIELLAEPFEVGGHRIVIGTSIGIAFAPHDALDPDQLLRCADLALYRAKVDGRGVYRLFHAEMDAQMQARRLLELDLRQALQAGQLEVFYQPLVDVRDRCIAGFEALLRWHHPHRGLVPPSEFIPLAEEIGLITSIGEWVLRQACQDAVSWPGTSKVAVNLSAAQFKSHNLVNATASALRESGLPASRLELEITETVMLQDTEATLATLHDLRALGTRIAMDDFGTGYSSLSYLRRFPFDRIKIDQSFVREMGIRPDCGAIVRAVAGLSSELGIATTAEGVETREQLHALSIVGCTEVQGYLFSPAVPGRDIPSLLARLPPMIDAFSRPAVVHNLPLELTHV